ncbi:MAG TPA: hypothetical protein VM429_12070 [Micropruina sp.]|nr:hypothetical protein [Micropruina sp.]
MALYARPSWKLARQVGADLFVACWTIAWWFTAQALANVIHALAEPSRATESAARSMHSGFQDAARNLESVPWAGPTLRQPFDAAAAGMQQVLESAHQQVVGIEQVATLTGWLAFLIPVTIVLVIWLPQRIRFVLNSSAAARFIDAQPDLDLLALRAMATQPFHQLARISDDPLAAWRSGDRRVIDQLADLELRRNGLHRPKLQDASRPQLPASTGAQVSTGSTNGVSTDD